MSRDYGRLGNGRRSGSAIWQWMIIGAVLGFGCAAAAFLVLLVTQTISLDPGERITPTALVQVVTATVDPNQPTAAPMVITATTEPRPTQEANVIIPSSTPPITNEPVVTEETVVTQEAAATNTQPVATQSVDSADPNATQETRSVEDTGTAETTGGQVTAEGVLPGLEGIGSPLLPVAGGTFLMGTTPIEAAEAVRICIDDGGQCDVNDAQDAYPQHNVTLNAFSIERTEVTLEQYVFFLNELRKTGVDHSTGCGGYRCVETKVENPDTNISYDSNLYLVEPDFISDRPVVFVSWYGADAYCRALGRRLPTEAEWEFAARGLGNNVYPWGNNLDVTYASTSRSVDANGVSFGLMPVGSFNAIPPSPFGTVDQAGNAGEWVADWYGAYPSNDVTDPTGPAAGSQKVYRGGTWADNPYYARTMHRLAAAPTEETPTIGFRCADDAEVPATTLGGNTTGTTPAGSLGNATFEAPAGTPDPSSLGVIGGSTETGGAAPTLAAATQTPVGGPTQPSLPPGG